MQSSSSSISPEKCSTGLTDSQHQHPDPDPDQFNSDLDMSQDSDRSSLDQGQVNTLQEEIATNLERFSIWLEETIDELESANLPLSGLQKLMDLTDATAFNQPALQLELSDRINQQLPEALLQRHHSVAVTPQPLVRNRAVLSQVPLGSKGNPINLSK